jgi:prefoldin alpha subunit
MPGKTPKDEKHEDLNQLGYARQVYQNQYALVNNSAQLVLQEMRELEASQTTLENIGLLNSRESLIATGAGVYIRAVPNNTSTVLVEVGGSYVAEKSIDEAKAFISKQVTAKTEVLNRLLKSKRDLEASLIEIEYKMESAGTQV